MMAGTMFSNYRFILTTHSDIFLWHASSCVTTHRSVSHRIFSSLSPNIFSQTAKKRLGEEDNVSSVFQTHTWIAQVAIWAFWLITRRKCKTIYFLRFLFKSIISTPWSSLSEGGSTHFLCLQPFQIWTLSFCQLIMLRKSYNTRIMWDIGAAY